MCNSSSKILIQSEVPFFFNLEVSSLFIEIIYIYIYIYILRTWFGDASFTNDDGKEFQALLEIEVGVLMKKLSHELGFN